jgi:hypothetical protein
MAGELNFDKLKAHKFGLIERMFLRISEESKL